MRIEKQLSLVDHEKLLRLKRKLARIDRIQKAAKSLRDAIERSKKL